MPRFPEISTAAGGLPSSIFARLVDKLAGYRGEVFPFHLGDTHLLPPAAARLAALSWEEAEAGRLYNYATPAGDPELLGALVAKLNGRNGLPVHVENLQVTAGATHVFSCATRALLDAGDEVLLLAPFWPLIRGHLISVGARAVEIPFSSRLYAAPDLDPRALLEPFITPRTAAIYVITPNNPDGKVLGARELQAIADVARRHDLWVLADEVYEEYAFDGRRHLSIAALPGMMERTITAFSFSKSYGQAGLRVGYAVGPAAAMSAVRKLANHSIYNVPRAMQRAALAALRTGEGFLSEARTLYRQARDVTCEALSGKLPVTVPEGGSYVFIDLAPFLGGGELFPLLERLASAGILLAPGEAFGQSFATHARLCYTAVPLERLRAGLARLVELL
jgi:aspartate/methionine/tyrosine aminotransferase